VRAIYDNLLQKLIKSNTQSQALVLNSDKNSNGNLKILNSNNLNTQKNLSLINLFCNNCGKNILEKVQNLFKNPVIQGCFECGKFLPQCAICLQFMSINSSTILSAHGININKQIINNNQSPKTQQPSISNNNNNNLCDDNYSFLQNNKFGLLFSWCMNCKHGGHLKHLAEWFKIHTKCPFPHCKCSCLQLDII
jgi:hypothetical protein